MTRNLPAEGPILCPSNEEAVVDDGLVHIVVVEQVALLHCAANVLLLFVVADGLVQVVVQVADEVLMHVVRALLHCASMSLLLLCVEDVLVEVVEQVADEFLALQHCPHRFRNDNEH